MAAPKLTIAMPVYNGMPYLEEAIESVFAQGFADWELILADNDSTDGTEELCRKTEARDGRVRYYRHSTNMGAAPNFNYCVDQARGEYFKWAASDDIMAPEWAGDSVEALDRAGPEAVLAYCRVDWIDEGGALLETYGEGLPWTDGTPHQRLRCLLGDPVDSHLFKCSPICGVSRLDVLRTTELIGPFNGSDKVTLVEMALRGRWVEIPKPHFKRRKHKNSSLEANRTPEQLAEWFHARRRKGFPMPRTTLFQKYLRAIQRAPIGRKERVRCMRVLLRFFRSEWRVMGGEYKIKVKEKLGLRPRA